MPSVPSAVGPSPVSDWTESETLQAEIHATRDNDDIPPEEFGFYERLTEKTLQEPDEQTVLTRPGSHPLYCDIHYWMTGFIYTAAHPYHAISGADGTCTLTNVPPGQYRIGCWHEGMRVTLQQNGAEISGYEFSMTFVAKPR